MSTVNAVVNRLTKGTGLLLDDPQEAARAARLYPASSVLTGDPDRPVYWRPGALLDQGREGACTGFAATAELLAEPMSDTVSSRLGNAYGSNHYRRSRVWMGWHPTEGSPGSTLRANAEVAVERGLIEAFYWPQTIPEVRAAVTTLGPVVLGANWYGCFTTNLWGVFAPARPVPSTYSGGHSVTITAYHPEFTFRVGTPRRNRTFKAPGYRIRNSWGTAWGKRIPRARKKGIMPGTRTGDGWITEDNLFKLLTGYGNYPNEPGRLDVQAAVVYTGRKPVDLARLLEKYSDPRVG